jgi:hypothetical protein
VAFSARVWRDSPKSLNTVTKDIPDADEDEDASLVLLESINMTFIDMGFRRVFSWDCNTGRRQPVALGVAVVFMVVMRPWYLSLLLHLASRDDDGRGPMKACAAKGLVPIRMTSHMDMAHVFWNIILRQMTNIFAAAAAAAAERRSQGRLLFAAKRRYCERAARGFIGGSKSGLCFVQ